MPPDKAPTLHWMVVLVLGLCVNTLPFLCFAAYALDLRDLTAAAVTFFVAPIMLAIGATVGARIANARVLSAPGGLLEATVRWLPFSKRGKAEVFGQLIADMRQDYIEAIAARRQWRARAVVVHGYATFGVTLIVYIGSAGLKRVIEIWKLV
jgi:hypothetical protein